MWWYLSDVINDLAFVFNYISDIEKTYADYGLLIESKILVQDKGTYIVAVCPYEPTYARRIKDTQSDF